MGIVSTALVPTSVPEGQELGVVNKRPRATEVAPRPVAKPQLYVKVAARNNRLRIGPTIKEPEAPIEWKTRRPLD